MTHSYGQPSPFDSSCSERRFKVRWADKTAQAPWTCQSPILSPGRSDHYCCCHGHEHDHQQSLRQMQTAPSVPIIAPIFPTPTPALLQRARPHSSMPAPVLHNFGFGPTPLFGWESVMPLTHGYGMPKYARRVKPDYRRFCFSVGKADVPYAALPGGPLWGFPTTMSPQLVGRW